MFIVLKDITVKCKIYEFWRRGMMFKKFLPFFVVGIVSVFFLEIMLNPEQTILSKIANNKVFSQFKKETHGKTTSSSQLVSLPQNKTNNNVMEWTKTVQQWIADFPFPQEKTHSILSGNPPEVANALSKFDQKIRNNIINNKKLSHSEKSQILWDIFLNANWLGDDNALKAIVQDYLAGIAPFELSQNILYAYQDLTSEGEKSINARQDFLEIADAILKLNKNISAQEKTEYNQKVSYIKELLLMQIRNTETSIEEIKALTANSVSIYLENANKKETETLISDLQATIGRSSQYSGTLYDIALRNILSQPEKSDFALNMLLQSSPSAETKMEMNKSLTFLLKEDGNISLADVSKEMKADLLTYLQSQANNVTGTEIETDWKASISRLLK
jgi:hypothetical protein